MGKLFRQIFKEDIKTVFPWMLSPMLIAAVCALLYKATDFYPITLIIFISMTVMTFAPLISIATLAGNDNTRFYGKKAAFYTSLPLKSEKITGARLINFLVMGLVIALISIFNLIIFGTTGESGLEPLDILKYIVENIDLKLVLISIKTLILSVMFYGVFSLAIMASNTLGSSNPFKKIGKAARGLLFVAIFLLQAYLYTKTIGILANSSLVSFNEYRKTIGTGYINMLDFNWASYALIVLIFVVFGALYFALTNYFHKKKLSVE